MIQAGDTIYDEELGILTVMSIEANGWLEVIKKGGIGFPWLLQEEIAVRMTLLDLYLLTGVR